MQNSKRNILILSVLSAVTCIGTVGGVLFANIFEPVSANATYEIKFDSKKNKINGGSTTTTTDVYTEIGTKYTMTHYSLYTTSEDSWATLVGASWFSFLKDTSHDRGNGFNGMKTLQINFSNENVLFRLSFSSDGTFNNKHSRTYKSSKSMTIDFEGHPNYFKFTSYGMNTINSMTITYSCSISEDENWNKTHGVVPVISEDNKTMTYGLYPQTIVSPITESDLVSELTKKAEELGVADEKYFWYNNEYYVKDTANPPSTEKQSKFSDGTTAVSGDTYFFKCEPIKWNIKSNDENYVVDCSNLIYGQRFDGGYSTYSSSELRTWLNEGFYDTAFFITTTSSHIVPTKFDEIGEDYDNVWIGSKDQYATWYTSNSARQKEVSDFAICNHVWLYNNATQANLRKGYYWSRTSAETDCSWIIGYDGIFLLSTVYSTSNGVSPSLTLKK